MMPRASALTAGFALAGAALTCPAPAPAQHGVNPAYIDTTCSPCSDFFTYANGAWLKTATIPAAYAGTGAARELSDRNTETLRRVLEGAAASADTARDPTLRKLGAFYASCMDSARAERAGAAPIAWSSAASASRTTGDCHARSPNKPAAVLRHSTFRLIDPKRAPNSGSCTRPGSASPTGSITAKRIPPRIRCAGNTLPTWPARWCCRARPRQPHSEAPSACCGWKRRSPSLR